MTARAWVRARSGPLTPRQMSAALTRIARFVGRAPAQLAVSRIAQRQDPFAVLVSTIISLRTRDEVTEVASERLLALGKTPAALARIPAARIARLIYPAGFYRNKAKTLRALARTLIAQHGGSVPDTLDELLALHGVGRKTANLVLTLGYAKPSICVDTHVHRICNRLGFVRTREPDQTELVLRARLPRRWWLTINDILVAFGRVHCGPLSPRCSSCPARALCHRVGVLRSR
ncbi:MAG TPA: endonuclease III [Polyangia bacterium]|nr:endonuclease III [Polyangia bacterium]